MRNTEDKHFFKGIRVAVASLPYFNIVNLLPFASKSAYLKIALSRQTKKDNLIRLKKGVYVSAEYINETRIAGRFNDYSRLVANILNEPSYLSLETVMYENGLLTEMPNNFTSVTANKTIRFRNKLGIFIYRHIRPALFTGFNVERRGNYAIRTATSAKALFDFIYLRKNYLTDSSIVRELRINIERLTIKDKVEIKRYIALEGSKKIETIFKYLYEGHY